jgi:hypothetical protein
MHRTTPQFWQRYKSLPDRIKQIATDNFELLKKNPRHPSLHFKKIGRFWSVRAGLSHRALGIEDGNDIIWLWIGTHDEYRRLYRQGR